MINANVFFASCYAPMDQIPPPSSEPLSDKELKAFIARHLPAWLSASDANDADSIVLHEAAFGTSTHELLLFACAIKYAATKGKHVHVVSGVGKARHQPETALPHPEVSSVYRDSGATKQSAARRAVKRSAGPGTEPYRQPLARLSQCVRVNRRRLDLAPGRSIPLDEEREVSRIFQ